jgi:hypothetical protein
MTKNEIYTAIVLITTILISVLWKEELKYRRNFTRVKSSIELKTESPHDSINAVPTKGYLGKAKLDPKGWLEKYEKFIIFNTSKSDDA